MALIPYVVERTQDGERSFDLYSRLLEDRIIMISGEVTQESMDVAVAELLYLNSKDNTRPIFLYINSPGGSVVDGMALVSTMNYVTAPVYTICTGMAASMGGVILSAGEKGHRYCMANSQILVHPMSGGTHGRTRDSSIEMNYEKRLEKLLIATIACNCGKMSPKAKEEILNKVGKMNDKEEYPDFTLSPATKKEYDNFIKDYDYDHWMFAKQALEFGIVDQVLESEKDLESIKG
jgi:ATP-dependent Clp protease protease subunit